MQFELNKPTDYSDKAFIEEIRRVANRVDKPLTKSKFDMNSKYSSSTIEKRFGGWLIALQKAELDETYIYTENKEITKEIYLNELKKVSVILGTKSFSAIDFEKNSSIGHRTIFSKKFGSFAQIMKESGFIVPLKGKKYTDEEKFENLLNVWTHYGRQPSFGEMKKAPSIIGIKAYITSWGSWKNALLAFVEKVNSDDSIISASGSQILNDIPIKTKKLLPEDRREISVGLRFKILKRDNYICKICGRSPANILGLELHVDHKIPFSKGGKTNEENLRTLCSDCNIGKSDQFD